MNTNVERPELIAYKGRVARGWWLIIVIAAIFGGLAQTVTSSKATRYVTSSLVSPPNLVNNPPEAAQYISDFVSAATSEVVLKKVSSDVDVTFSRLKNRLKVKQLSTSAIVEVAYSAANRTDASAQAVVNAVVVQTEAFLDRDLVNQLESAAAAGASRVARANKLVTDTAGKRAAAIAAAKGVALPELMSAMQRRSFELRLGEYEATASGDAVGAAAFAAKASLINAEIAKIRPRADQISMLDAALTAAEANLEQIKTTNLALDVVPSPTGAVLNLVAKPIDQSASATRRAVAVGGAGALIGLIIVLWTPLFEKSRSKRQMRPKAP